MVHVTELVVWDPGALTMYITLFAHYLFISTSLLFFLQIKLHKCDCQNDETLKFALIRRHSVYCLVDELLQGSFLPRWRKKKYTS